MLADNPRGGTNQVDAIMNRRDIFFPWAHCTTPHAWIFYIKSSIFFMPFACWRSVSISESSQPRLCLSAWHSKPQRLWARLAHTACVLQSSSGSPASALTLGAPWSSLVPALIAPSLGTPSLSLPQAKSCLHSPTRPRASSSSPWKLPWVPHLSWTPFPFGERIKSPFCAALLCGMDTLVLSDDVSFAYSYFPSGVAALGQDLPLDFIPATPSMCRLQSSHLINVRWVFLVVFIALFQKQN